MRCPHCGKCSECGHPIPTEEVPWIKPESPKEWEYPWPYPTTRPMPHKPYIPPIIW